MFIIDKTKASKWLAEEFITEFEEYLKTKTTSKDGYYYFNFENFLIKKKYLKDVKTGEM